MNKKHIALILGVMLYCGSAMAQWSVGLRSGWTHTSISRYDGGRMDEAYSALGGFEAGVQGCYTFNSWLAVRANLSFMLRSHRMDRNLNYIDPVYTEHINRYLMLPVVADFSFGGERLRGHLLAGAYAGAWLSEHRRGTTYWMTDYYVFFESFDETREFNDEVAKDYIIRQSAESGQTLRKGDTVMLYVSDGYEEVVTTQETHADPAFNSAQGSSVLSGYEAENVLNNDAKCWATEKDGKDAFITLRANGDQWVKGVYFGNGNIGDFQNWGRVTNVRFEFSDGTSVEKSISDISDLQTIDFGREVKTNSMKITILDSKAGAEHESTCITYIKAY